MDRSARRRLGRRRARHELRRHGGARAGPRGAPALVEHGLLLAPIPSRRGSRVREHRVVPVADRAARRGPRDLDGMEHRGRRRTDHDRGGHRPPSLGTAMVAALDRRDAVRSRPPPGHPTGCRDVRGEPVALRFLASCHGPGARARLPPPTTLARDRRVDRASGRLRGERRALDERDPGPHGVVGALAGAPTHDEHLDRDAPDDRVPGGDGGDDLRHRAGRDPRGSPG